MTELKFEFKNLLKSKLVIVGVIISILVSVLNFGYNSINQHQIRSRVLEEYSTYHRKLQEEANEARKTILELGHTMAKVDEYLVYNKKLTTAVDSVILTLDGDDYQELPHKMTEFYRVYHEYRDYKKSSRFFLDTIADLQKETWVKNLSERGLPYEDPEYSLSGFNFAKSVAVNLSGMPILIFIIFFASQFLLGEVNKKNDFLRGVQPISKLRRNISKITVSTLFITIIYILILVFSFVLAAVFKNSGTVNYPVPNTLVGFKDTITLIPIGIILLRYVFVVFILAIFISSIVLLTGNLMGDGLVVSAVIIPAFLFLNDITTRSYNSQIMRGAINKLGFHLNPLFYPFSIQMSNAYRVHFLVMLIVCLIYSGVIMLGTIKLSENPKVQNLKNFSLNYKIEKKMERFERKSIRPFPNYIFEIKKILKNRMVIITMLLFIGLVTFSAVNNFSMYKKVRNSTISSIEFSKMLEEEMIKGNEGPSKNNHIRNLEILEEISENLKHDDRGFLLLKLYNLELIEGHQGYSGFGFTPTTARLEKSLLNEVESRGKETTLSKIRTGMITPFDYPRSIGDYFLIREITIPYHKSIDYTIYNLFSGLILSSMSLLLLLIVGTGISDERHKSKSIFLLNIQPVKSWRIYISKIMAKTTIIILSVAISLCLSVVIIKSMGGRFEPDYPVIKYHNEFVKDGKMHGLRSDLLTVNQSKPQKDERIVAYSFRDIVDENIEMLTLLLLGTVLVIAISNLISLFIKSRWIVSTVSILIVGVGYLLSLFNMSNAISGLFLWLNPKYIATGEAEMVSNQSLLAPISTIAIIITCSILLIFVGITTYNTVFKRK